MEMDWPSTFRADLSIQTYQDLANVAVFVDWRARLNFDLLQLFVGVRQD
jgi:hypothetical protein